MMLSKLMSVEKIVMSIDATMVVNRQRSFSLTKNAVNHT